MRSSVSGFQVATQLVTITRHAGARVDHLLGYDQNCGVLTGWHASGTVERLGERSNVRNRWQPTGLPFGFGRPPKYGADGPARPRASVWNRGRPHSPRFSQPTQCRGQRVPGRPPFGRASTLVATDSGRRMGYRAARSATCATVVIPGMPRMLLLLAVVALVVAYSKFLANVPAPVRKKRLQWLAYAVAAGVLVLLVVRTGAVSAGVLGAVALAALRAAPALIAWKRRGSA